MKAIGNYLKVIFKKTSGQYTAASLNALSPLEMAALVSNNIEVKQTGNYWWIEE